MATTPSQARDRSVLADAFLDAVDHRRVGAEDILALDLRVGAAVARHLAEPTPALALEAVLRVVDARAELLGASKLLDEAALDKYSFTRDIYLQRHRRVDDTGDSQPEERYDLPEETTPAGPEPAAPAVK